MNDAVLREPIVNSFDVTVHHMRCAEHTFQLGIKDALKLNGLGRFLSKFRDIAGRLGAPRTDAILKHHNNSIIIDVGTHLGSTFAMLKRLLELRSTIKHEDSRKVQELIDVLAIPQSTILQLQRENFTPGGYFSAWHQAIFKLRQKMWLEHILLPKS